MVEDKSGSKQDAKKKNLDQRGYYQFTTRTDQIPIPYLHAVLGCSSGVRKQNQCIVVNPLVVSQRGQVNRSHVKSKRLPEIITPNKQSCFGEDRKNNRKVLQSKIPVLKSKINLPSISNKNTKSAAIDSTLSASDRRQKFQQSHCRLGCTDAVLQPAPQYKVLTLPPLAVQRTIPAALILNDPKGDFPKFPKIEIGPHVVYYNAAPITSKTTLPSIKRTIPATTVTENASSVNGKKKKGLHGEFTHFPALCNISQTKPIKRSYVSSIPNLPPILPTPAPPPPSVSASLEQEMK